jgi:hypothetical protein
VHHAGGGRFFRGDEIYVGGREKRARGRETGHQSIVEAAAATASMIAVLQPKNECEADTQLA